MKGKLKYVALGICAILIFSTLSIGTLGNIFSESTETNIVLVSIEDEDDISKLKSAGIDILEKYPDRALVEITGSPEEELLSIDIPIANRLPARTQISIKGHNFNIEKEMPQFSEELTIDSYEEGEEGLYIIHMKGPVHPEWRTQLEELDVDIINYQPNYAYEVSMTPEQAEDVEDLYFVDWVGIYQPGFKLAENVDQGIVSVTFADGERRIMEVEGENELMELANRNDVYYISQYREPELLDEMATQITGGGLWVWDPEDDPDSAYRGHGDYGSLANQLGYEGEGVVTAVADTGLGDGTEGDAGHPDFGDRVIGGYGYEEDARTGFSDTLQEDDWSDGHGHGTHVAGSIGGNTHQGTGETVYEDYYAGQGSAPETELFSVKIFDGDGGWIGPADDYHEIVEIAKQEGDAYIHSNSWGVTGDLGAYLESSEDYDAAVRDANRASAENEPMVITVAAGNQGPDDNTVGAPATGKNVIGVGATENYNPAGPRGALSTQSPSSEKSISQEDLLDNPDRVVDLSSRGWTDDNRVKPDLVAPGEEIYSTAVGGGYEYRTGTSMACPAVSGSASVVVDWFEDEYGTRPSPAMVKALLINTAYQLDVEEGNTDTIPNRDEGWGMVNLPELVNPSVDFNIEDQTSLLETGQVDERYVEYQEEGEPLKITLTYTDKEASVGDDPTLKNDLNLEVESPTGETYIGNAFDEGWTPSGEEAMSDFDTTGDGYDDVNNVQNIYISPDDLEEGPYKVQVIGEDIPADANNDGEANQDYALVMQNTIEIDGPSIEIDRPSGGETFAQGDTETIEWTTEEGDADINAVDLEYSLDDGDTWSEIAEGLDDTGNYDWEIPTEGSNEARIRATVHDENSLSGSDVSDPFIIAPQITITSPEKGEIWNVDYEEQIEWETHKADSAITGVDLEYSTDDGDSWNTIVEETDDDGGFTWMVPEEDTEEARIRAAIEDEADRSDEDVSNRFTIRTPEPRVPSDPEPEDGEDEVSIDPELSVYVEHDAEESMDVTFFDASDKTEIDTVHDAQSGTRVSITWEDRDYNTMYGWYAEAEHDDITAQSETWRFTTREPIRPSIEIERPRGGAVWSPGDIEPITWDSSRGEGGAITHVDLEYSVDNGDSWSEIDSDVSDTGSYDWEVPNRPTNLARVHATVYDEEGWTGEDTSHQFTISEKEYSLSIDIEGEGSTVPEEGTHSYEEGEEVTVTATPDDGWYFDQWSGDREGTEREITLTMDEDKEITASFEEIEEYTLTIRIEGEGSTTPSEGTHTYTSDESVSLTATADDGWYFNEWSGDYEGADHTVTITMDDDKFITANFEEIQDHLLTINIEGEGTTTPSEGRHTYEDGDEVTITPTPEEHWYFEEWSGDHTGTEEVAVITMDEDMEITANFEIYRYELNVLKEGEGTVEVDPDQEQYEHGSEVDLTAISDEGWYFDQWSGDHTGTEEEITLIMDEDKEITANFEAYEYDLRINIEGEGSVEADPDRSEYAHGTEVELTAIPDDGWYFKEWTGDFEGEDDEIAITMDEEKAITAVFEEIMYTLEVSIEGEGTVEIFPDQDEYREGSEVTLVAEPDEGWYFEEWTGDHSDTDEEITIEMDEDKDITARFDEIADHLLTISIEGEGTTEPDVGTHTYEDGTPVTVTATPGDGWYFVEWTGDHTGTEEEITVTMDEDMEITANFEILEYDLTIDIDGEGTTDPTEGTHVYSHGEEVSLTATPEDEWSFIEWSGDISSSEDEITITMDEDKEITANFGKAYFEVEIITYDDEVGEGEDFTVQYRVRNTGDGEGTQDIALYLDGEQLEVYSDLTLGPGEQYDGEFTVSAEDVGEHALEISSGDSSDSRTMTIEDEGFLSNYWWIIPLLAAVVAIFILLFLMKGKEEETEEESGEEPPIGTMSKQSVPDESKESTWEPPSDEESEDVEPDAEENSDEEDMTDEDDESEFG